MGENNLASMRPWGRAAIARLRLARSVRDDSWAKGHHGGREQPGKLRADDGEAVGTAEGSRGRKTKLMAVDRDFPRSGNA